MIDISMMILCRERKGGVWEVGLEEVDLWERLLLLLLLFLPLH